MDSSSLPSGLGANPRLQLWRSNQSKLPAIDVFYQHILASKDLAFMIYRGLFRMFRLFRLLLPFFPPHGTWILACEIEGRSDPPCWGS